MSKINENSEVCIVLEEQRPIQARKKFFLAMPSAYGVPGPGVEPAP